MNTIKLQQGFGRHGMSGPRAPSVTLARVTAAFSGAARRSAGKAPDRRGGGVVDALAAPFRLIARLFFSDLKLERKGKNLNVKLAAKAPEVRQPAPVDKAMAEALPLRAALKTLLDSHARTRRVMRHLAFFEGALAIHGLKATAEVPVEVLSVAVGQLEALVGNWSNPGLAELRSKMAVAIVERSRDPFYGAGGDELSNFNTHSRLMVGDASHSMFLELEKQYRDLLPAQAIQAALDPIRVELATGAAPAARR